MPDLLSAREAEAKRLFGSPFDELDGNLQSWLNETATSSTISSSNLDYMTGRHPWMKCTACPVEIWIKEVDSKGVDREVDE